MRRLITLSLFTLLLGCSTYEDDLNGKLSPLKTAEEKRVVLAERCQHQIQEELNLANPASVQHSKNMQEICEQMTGHKPGVDYRAK